MNKYKEYYPVIGCQAFDNFSLLCGKCDISIPSYLFPIPFESSLTHCEPIIPNCIIMVEA
jgi:hypothetical protein